MEGRKAIDEPREGASVVEKENTLNPNNERQRIFSDTG